MGVGFGLPAVFGFEASTVRLGGTWQESDVATESKIDSPQNR